MRQIIGYGEDAFTLWALKHKTSIILNSFQDQTAPSDCLFFYRPSFGRSGGEESAEFGEFDAIIGSSDNIYLIESKWDNSPDSKMIRSPLERNKNYDTTSFHGTLFIGIISFTTSGIIL